MTTERITYELDDLDDGTVALRIYGLDRDEAARLLRLLRRDRESGAIVIPDGARVMIMGPREVEG